MSYSDYLEEKFKKCNKWILQALLEDVKNFVELNVINYNNSFYNVLKAGETVNLEICNEIIRECIRRRLTINETSYQNQEKFNKWLNGAVKDFTNFDSPEDFKSVLNALILKKRMGGYLCKIEDNYLLVFLDDFIDVNGTFTEEDFKKVELITVNKILEDPMVKVNYDRILQENIHKF